MMTRRATGMVLVAAALAAAGTTGASAQSAPDPRHPVIAGFGPVTPMPGTAGQPDPSLAYKVVFDVTEGAEKPDQLNPGLDKAARFVNLLGSAGIRTERGGLVAVHAHHDALLGFHFLLVRVGALADRLHLVSLLQCNSGPAHPVDFVYVLGGGLFQPVRQALDVVGAAQRIGGLRHAALVGKDLLSP